jgi:hypothetical protein
MERTGEGDNFRFDDLPAMDRPPVFTPEGRVLTAAGLVLSSLLVGGLFQFLGFIVLDRVGPYGEAVQYAIFAGPSGAMAAAGAWLGRRTMGDLELDRVLRGLAAASFVIGAVIAASAALGVVIGFALDPTR